ncbi:hypothetical protein PCASD_24282 [Puccinia coronata f. sp. avenae]|uniref:BZIP domain-containing protein n=1 Tax=Puccinia coronata f. sp. avenae TaxID=200324 RepID=A0A2N5TK80_9BASI|nr:hypothetical protein PCASD_24282 [Puccinia coronata f. sp. avenae]
MDPLAHASLPPDSHPVTHSCAAYPHNDAYTSDYREEHPNSSGVAKPKIEMGEYYLPTSGINTSHHRTQLPFPISPSSYRPSLPYSEDISGMHQNQLRPTSSSSIESYRKSEDGRELLYAQRSAYPFEYGYANSAYPTRPYTSTTSSENEIQSFHEAANRRTPDIKNKLGFNGVQEFGALTSINSQPTSNSCSPADQSLIRQEEYAGDLIKADVEKCELSESEHSPKSKPATGKKASSIKVSEKRRQQNRAAQRAMRERRKRAAQHQEIHMSAIVTENIMLREKVTYLSNILLRHAINPGGHPSWTPLPPQDNRPPMLPSLHNGNPSAPPALVADANCSSITPNLAAGHSNFSPGSLACSSAFPSAHGPVLNYYPSGPFELDYTRHGNDATGIRNLSGPSSTSNLSRPGTAEDLTVGSHVAAFGRWQNPTSNEGISFQNESSIAATMGHFGLVGSVATDSCSINTASTIPSPTQTDHGQLVEAIPANL